MKEKGNSERKKKHQRFKDFPNYFQVEGTFDVRRWLESFLCNSMVDFFWPVIARHLLVVITPLHGNIQLTSVDFSVIDTRWKIR
jgi:hypothetical protein